jgi:mono/diheme cytochrome c family protein
MKSADGKDVYAAAMALSVRPIFPTAHGEIMYGIVRYSFTIVASFCVAVLAGERAFGQAPKGEAAYGSWHDDRPRQRQVRLLFDTQGKPTGEYEDFMTGVASSDSPVWGLPVGVVSKDGTLIVTPGSHGTIWIATYHETAQGIHNADTGRDLYIANCSACHQAGGEGLPGVVPPLRGSGVVNKDDAGKHIQVILNGMQGARAGGVVYAAVMPKFAGALSDAEISDIINYERSSWGNHGAPVTAAQVAAERARPK